MFDSHFSPAGRGRGHGFAHQSDHSGAEHGHEHGHGGAPLRGPGGHGFGPGFGGPGFGGGFGPFGPGFGPGRGRSRARRGDVRLVLLSLLSTEPANGYGLIRAIAERTEGRWRPSPGSVYPTLQQLVDEGLVEGSGEGRGDVYTLTDAGRSYVAEHAAELDAAWGGLPGHDHEPDEFTQSAMRLVAAVLQFAQEASPEQRAAAAVQFDQLRKALYGTLAE
jgi:DNA-binding PadR family transcriptional regulator